MLLHADITEKILGIFYKVYNQLGYGFLEKVYENSLIIEFKMMDLLCIQQSAIKVYYAETEVGNYFADILVENKIIVEIKAGKGEILKNMKCKYSII